METGLLNFHDEETFATSLYDQGDFSGADGQNSLLDMMHTDLQYSSDYLNQSAAHWDSDQEQEHNGDLAVLPVAPSECSSLNSSKEDYNKSLFDWQENLLPYQPLDPDGVDLRMDGEVIPSELPDNIFEDSFESSNVSSNPNKSNARGPLVTPPRCSTPKPSPKDSTASSDGSLNLDMSLSTLDVNVSDIDVSALGINVSSLDIKADNTDVVEAKINTSFPGLDHVEGSVAIADKPVKVEEIPKPTNVPLVKSESSLVEDDGFSILFGAPEGPSPFQGGSEFVSEGPISEMENSEVEQLHDIAMEFIKEEQEAQEWASLPAIDDVLANNVDLDSINTEVPVLEAGNLESLLEQFEASLQPAPEFTQSMPASPAHISIPPSPLSMPASPSCITVSPSLSAHLPNASASATPPLRSPVPSPSKVKAEPTTPSKTSPLSKGASVLHQNILESLPTEIMDRIKASGRKKTIPLIPAMPSKRPNRSSTRMHAAGAALSRNKLLKLVSRKGENVQFDHDYCSNDSQNNLEFVPDKLLMDIKASTRQMELDEDKSSRKDSGLESGEDSEGAVIPSGLASGSEMGFTGTKGHSNSILKSRVSTQPGRNKEMLMVSVLKKVRCDAQKSSAKQLNLLQQVPKPKEAVKASNVQSILASPRNVKPPGNRIKVEEPSHAKLSCTQVKVEPTLKPPINVLKSVNGSEETCKAAATTSAAATSVKSMGVTHVDTMKTKKQTVVLTSTLPVQSHASRGVVVKQEPPEPSEEYNTAPEAVEANPPLAPVKLPDQPKKRKLNLEEYRSRRALEQKRDSKLPMDIQKGELSSSCEPMCEKSEQPHPKLDESSCKQISVKLEGNEENIETVQAIEAEKKNLEHSSEQPPPNNSELVIKQEDDVEKSVTISVKDSDDIPKPVEEKKKQRQYRTRHLSTSSSEGSPLKKEIIKPSSRNGQRKAVWSPPRIRSKSRSLSPTSSRSSSRSSSSSSSSGGDSTRRTRRRSRRRSCSSRSSSSSSSRSRSRSNRRSNSVSSDSSRGSRRSSRSRRRTRSRSRRRTRRDRERSASRSTSRSGARSRRGSKSWKRWRRDSSRSRSRGSFRRERSRSRYRCGKSSSSHVKSCSGSRSRSRSFRRRYTSRSRSQSRARRNLNSYSSASDSRSRSRSWSSRSRSYCSVSRSRSRSCGRKRARLEERRRGKRSKQSSWRSRSPIRRNVDWSHVEKEHNRQIEERRVIYVGRIPEDTTKAELRRRFEVFGPIVDISLHFREHADNYGFVTFAYKVDAYEAVERGNDDPTQPPYELCFGGRRKFCRERYADLDGMACKSSMSNGIPHMVRSGEPNSFDDMLREVQAKLQARKKL